MCGAIAGGPVLPANVDAGMSLPIIQGIVFEGGVA